MFRVRWDRRALNQLAAAWTGATSEHKRLITLASNEIDVRLTAQPATQGESREAGRRVLVVPPLAVTFRIDGNQREAIVLNVRFFQRRSQP
jgi:hypothetical protein